MRVVTATALVGLFVMTASAAAPIAGVGAESTQDVIVVFHDDVADSEAVARELAVRHGAQIRHVYSYVLKGFVAEVPINGLAALQRDGRVALVELERVEHIVEQALPTGIDRIETDKNPTVTTDGSGTTVNLDVAVIDTGIDGDHPDLNVGGGINFTGGPSSNWDDGHGHGTHVAGTIGAVDNGVGVVGVAPGARVWGVKVCNNGGRCATGDIVAGIDWVAGKKSSGEINFAAANMSISTSDDKEACTGSSDAVHEAICGLVGEGVVFSLAAGNDGRVKDAYPEALAVSALSDFDGLAGGSGEATCRSDEDDTLANFSNHGAEVDIAAPGVCILSTWKDGGYHTISGTSMAAPHAAGAVALYLHANGLAPATNSAGVDAIEQAIIDAAHPQGDTCSYTDTKIGGPLLFVNAEAFGGDGSCDTTATPITDIAVTDVSAPSSVVTGDPVSVDVTVENVGNQTVTSDFDVTLTETDPDGTTTESVGTLTVTQDLDPGQTFTVNFSWSTDGESTGDHTLTGSHNFSDDNLDNDSKSTVVSVGEPLTDIAISDVSAPASVTLGDSVSVDVTVENVGNQTVTDSFDVTLTETDPDGTTTESVGTVNVTQDLDPGQTFTVNFSWSTDGESTGDHTLTGSHNLSDDNLDNDSKSTTITVSEVSSTDMWVEDIEPSVSTSGIWTNVTATVTILSGDGPVQSASMTFVLSRDTDCDGTFEDSFTFTATTDSNGEASFNLKTTNYEACWQGEVTVLGHDTYTWNSDLDTENPNVWRIFGDRSIDDENY